MGKKLHFFEAISELNIYKFSPWDLPGNFNVFISIANLCYLSILTKIIPALIWRDTFCLFLFECKCLKHTAFIGF